jgi:GMP synthase (glutamine-hydrolysing)
VDTSAIVILDFGSQYTQLIARRIREQNVFSAVLPCTASLDEIRAYKPIGLILSGGPSSVYDADAPAADPRILDSGLPILGICYGLQFITHHLGGKIRPADKREYGFAEVTLLDTDLPLFAGLPATMEVWMSHGDHAQELAPGFHLMAKTANALAGIANPARRIYAVQFHPEVHHTKMGTQLLKNFVFDICKAKADWTPGHFIETTVNAIREKVGKGQAICALSGGVDSSVAAVLVHRAIGDQLTCIFVNNGVLRKNEFFKVQDTMRNKLGLKLDAVDASGRFLSKLAGVTDPETKRKIIGNEFIAVFDDEAHRIMQTQGEVDFLVQGTLYPDVIESSSVKGPSQTIKSHHNVGGLPENMKMNLIEPLRDLF